MTVAKSDLPFNGWYMAFGLCVAWLALYRTTLPGFFHLRVILRVLRQLFGGSKTLDLEKDRLLHEIVWLGDLDFNLHMNNAKYNELLDHARFDFFMAVGGADVMKEFGRLKVGNGGVSIFFLRELKPLQAFRIRTKVIGVDKKWCFFLHSFESGKKDSPKIHALASSKIVFKHKKGPEAGKTIPPAEVFQERGIKLPAALYSNNQEGRSEIGETLHRLLALYEQNAGDGIAAALGGPAGLRTPGPITGESTPLAGGAGGSSEQYAHEPSNRSSASSGGLRVRKA